MKKLIRHSLCSALALLSLGVGSVNAGFVSPNVPDSEMESPAIQAGLLGAVPPPPPAVWTVVNTHDAGPGSLRNAISSAAAGDTIQFALHRPAVIILRTNLVIDKNLTILGPGPNKLIVARMFGHHVPSFRVFRVNAGVVTIAGMTIFNGRAINTDGVSDNLGGGIYNRAAASLTVSNCVIARNVAPTEAGGNGFGGGIFSSGPLTIVNSTVRDNDATYAGGGICTFHSSKFVAEGCTVNGNFAGIQGGGVNFQGVSGSMKNCTISGNSTPSSNSDPEVGAGSGLLHIVFGNEGADLELAACTITRNWGSTIGAVVIAALLGNNGIVTRMIGTLVADNAAPNFFLDRNPVLQSLGYNLDSDGSSGLANGVNGDLVGTPASPIDARLGSLHDNGGPTRTHGLLHGSPALDAGAAVDADGAALTTDQRGFPRPQGAANDIGAFENQPPTVICPHGGTVECSGDLTATVNDPDGDALAIVWVVNGTAVETNFLFAVHPPHPRVVKLKASLAQGANTVTVRVSDGKAAVAQCSTIVVVRDTRPPRIIEVKANPHVLWPPNHRLVPVRVTVRAEDCGPIRCRIVSVRSNEPVGHEPDWIITGDLTLLLRAERWGRWHSRIYTITVECRDAVGNTSRRSVYVTVPHHWW